MKKEKIVIQTDKGKIKCSQVDTHLEGLGIPYAAPPVGDLRLRAPVEHEAWSDIRDATRFGSASLQTKTEYGEAQGSEDCLYLNVYKPNTADDSQIIPVMVWIHGGGFISGSGNSFYGANLAQTAQAIVVTINYRLGPLGWLGLPSLAAEAPDHSTGNYGLLDSIAALKWVKHNIAAFGGDPERVTIFGQSAGGEQIFALLASPMAVGLFHRAISMSAPATLPLHTVAENAKSRAEFLAKLDCTDETTQIANLRSLTAQQIIDAADESFNLLVNYLSWTPTVDGVVLPDQWVTLFREGRFNRVPVIMGHTKHEVRLMSAIYENDAGCVMTPAQAQELLKKFFGAKADRIAQEYGIHSVPEPFGPLSECLTDALFSIGLSNDRDALAQFVPVFSYQSYDPNASESHVHALYTKIGAGHDFDLPYLFQWDDFAGNEPEFSQEQQELVLAYGRYWGQFAANADPNDENLPHWPPTSDGQEMQYLEIQSTGGVRSVPISTYNQQHKMTFWKSMD